MEVLKTIFKAVITAAIIIVFAFALDFGSYKFFQKKEITKPVVVEKYQNAAVRNEKVAERSDVFEGTVDDIISLANQARTEKGLGRLSKNAKLSASAMAKAQDMKDKHYFDHVSPDGLQPWFFVEEAGYKYKTVGENLAEGYFSAQTVHEAWMQSEGHRENILSPDFEEIGVAVLEFEQNGLRSYIAVQHFGSQLRQEDLVVKTKCGKQSKKYCEDAEEKLDELEGTIEKQEEIIKDAKKDGADSDALKKPKENLEKLEDMKDDLEQYLDKCDEFIKGCDVWE